MTKENPPQLREARLTREQMLIAIQRIDRRLADLEAFDTESVDNSSDPRIDALASKLEKLLVDVFGSDTIEYERHHWDVTGLDRGSYTAGHPRQLEELRTDLRRGIANAKGQLEAIKSGFLEEISDTGATGVNRTLRAYDGLELHTEIARAASKLFHEGNYSNAVEDSVKALNNLVRLRSGIEKDGADLMKEVFSPNKPVLKFNQMTDQSEIDEQKGYMMLFVGAVTGIRNPRAHKIIVDEPERALEFIAFISLLAKLMDASIKA